MDLYFYHVNMMMIIMMIIIIIIIKMMMRVNMVVSGPIFSGMVLDLNSA